ncbi:MAG: DUF2254 domain-containing protein [Candidatus Competibacteraceae bacterium]|nr:DUF2254 domain-containing protein [Candidatus Competibacteraceae bacterium]
MIDRLNFFVNRLRERLWLKPLAMCVLSVGLAFLAKAADYGNVAHFVPNVSAETIETLLKIIAASMLVIATFAVGSMISSYASASDSATPRSFPLVISDDVSQNALSSFIGSFIFSIVSLIALLNGFYDSGGRFALFCLTLFAFAAVILTFVRWVDRIARLGRLGTTVDKAEAAAVRSFQARRRAPTLGGVPVRPRPYGGDPVYGETVGYVQRIEMDRLQKCAEESDMRIEVAALPGTFSMPGRPLAFIIATSKETAGVEPKRIAACFQVAADRTFDDDPRFGLLVLSEIASRALSPAVNDPGTAIDVINRFVGLFVTWNKPVDENDKIPCEFDRIEVPEISTHDMFDDAFTATARDGAGLVEVGVRLQKALHALARVGDSNMQKAAERHARLAIARAEYALHLPEDLDEIRSASMFARQSS